MPRHPFLLQEGTEWFEKRAGDAGVKVLAWRSALGVLTLLEETLDLFIGQRLLGNADSQSATFLKHILERLRELGELASGHFGGFISRVRKFVAKIANDSRAALFPI
jgi:hypothetical protein